MIPKFLPVPSTKSLVLDPKTNSNSMISVKTNFYQGKVKAPTKWLVKYIAQKFGIIPTYTRGFQHMIAPDCITTLNYTGILE